MHGQNNNEKKFIRALRFVS